MKDHCKTQVGCWLFLVFSDFRFPCLFSLFTRELISGTRPLPPAPLGPSAGASPPTGPLGGQPLVCALLRYMHGSYVRSTVSRYSTRYAKYGQFIDMYWTSFWLPIGSWWELRTKFEHFSAWNCASCLHSVSKSSLKHMLLMNIDNNGLFFQNTCCKKKVCGKPQTP